MQQFLLGLGFGFSSTMAAYAIYQVSAFGLATNGTVITLSLSLMAVSIVSLTLLLR